MTMLNVNIDGKELKGYAGQTILELARENGIEIPTLCHDERLKIYGACGLCVVEIEGSNKLARACATEISQGMVVITNSDKVNASRKMTLELLLSDHSGDCRPPCVKACPAHTDCQGYVGLIANGEYTEALKLIKEQVPLPASIGLVCPHPCEEACRRQLLEAPIAIAALKTFAAEQNIYSDNPYIPVCKEPTGKRVAIIGGGPAGLTAAYYLALEGHEVVVYEAMPQAGGMLRYGIPQYRLPKELLDLEISLIEAMGVDILCNTRINRDVSFEYIRQNFDAVFAGVGAWKYTRIGCPGEDVEGVIGGIDFLREAALNGNAPIGQRVAVIGGGNTAMDAARTAVRLGAEEVMVLYRRTRGEMPAEDIEIEEAEEEGVIFKFLLAPEEIIAEDGRAVAIRCQKMKLGEPDSSGRRKPVPIEGAVELIPVDTIIAAIGQQVDASDLPGIQIDKYKCIGTDANTLQTNLEGVFAGGDAVTGPGIAIEAIAQGKKAALAMNAYLNGEELAMPGTFTVERTGLTADDFADVKRVERVKPVHRDPAVRRNDFLEIAGRMTPEQARQEANRCLECGCQDYFECKLINYASEYHVDPSRLLGGKHPVMDHDEHPYIERDAAKCILCGLCIRICDEHMGVGALGLVHRGFDSLVKPEFGRPLGDTDCISCGQCVSVCPTGALIERNTHVKNVPLVMDKVSSHCSFCGLGCGQVISSRGETVFKIVPDKGQTLCEKGRFGFATGRERLRNPLLKTGEKLQECSWDEALTFIAKKGLAVKSKSAPGSIAIFASPALTMEEAQIAASWKELLATDQLASFSPDCGRGLAKVVGDSISTNSLDEMNGTDLILMLGSFNQNQVVPARIRKAVGQGAKVIVISNEKTLVNDIAQKCVCPENSTGFIKEMMASLVVQSLADEKFVRSRATGFDEIVADLEQIVPGEDAKAIAAAYGKAKKAMIIVDGYSVSADAVELMADLMVMAGKVGSARNGIIIINPGADSNGISQAGFNKDGAELTRALADGKINAAYILGEDPVGAGLVDAKDLAGLELLMVASPYMTDTTALADVVLPMSTSLEVSGSYITADGTMVPLRQAKESPAGKDNLDIWAELSLRMNPNWDIEFSYPSGSNAYKYAREFACTDGLAKLGKGSDGPIFVPVKITDPALI